MTVVDPNKPATPPVPTPPTPPAPGVPNAPVPPPPTPPNPPAPQAQGADDLDELGYAKPKAPPAPPTPPAKKEEAKPDPNEKPASGYSVEPPKPDDKKVDPPVPPVVDPNAPKDEYEFDAEDSKDLDPEEVKNLQGLAKKVKDAKTPKELVKALADFRKEENKQLDQIIKKQNEDRVAARNATKVKWDQELRSDPTFGGEKYLHNIMQVEKVLANDLPSVKKQLTETGAILPPNYMRDLASLAERLYGTPTLVEGEKIKNSEQGEVSKDDHLKFYT